MSFARTAWKGLVSVVLIRAGGRRRGEPSGEQGQQRPAEASAQAGRAAHSSGNGHELDPSKRAIVARPWSERTVAALLLVTMLACVCFAVLYVLEPNTQLLGISLGSGFIFLAAALIVAGKRVVPQVTAVEQRPELSHPQEVQELSQELREGLQGITRRRLLLFAASAAAAGLTGAIAIPVIGLGPGVTEQFRRTRWYAGRRLVTAEGEPIPAAQVGEGSMLTAFPEGTDAKEKEELGSPVVIVRVDPSLLKLPAGREDWAPAGILAYSKICTHAGCAISLYRSPLNPSTESRPPALVCPCHYSTFDVLDGAKVEFGPAGRPLPQLPLMIDSAGYLRANGNFSGPVGPSWWGDAQ